MVDLETSTVIDEFEAFVRPEHHPTLTAFCTELTSIEQSDVDGALLFPEVLRQYEAWLDRHGASHENALIATCGDWDLEYLLPVQLRASAIEWIPQIFRRWHNVKRMFIAHQGVEKAPGMEGMLEDLGLELDG